MAEGTAIRLVSRCTTVEEVVRAFRSLIRPDVPDRLDVSATGDLPAVGDHVKVAITLATKMAVIEGDAEVVETAGRLGLRFTRLDPRSKGLLAHMGDHRDREPPPVPRHLVPLGVAAGTAATARDDVALAECVAEPMSASGPAPRASVDLGQTIRQPGPAPRREETLRSVRPPRMTPVPPMATLGAAPAPAVPAPPPAAAPSPPSRREQQKTLMGLAPLSRPAAAPAPSGAGPVAHGTPPVPMPATGDSAATVRPADLFDLTETGPTGPARMQPFVESGSTTIPVQAGTPARIDDAPTIPHDDIVTDVAVALPDLPAETHDELDELDPIADPPAQVHSPAPHPQAWSAPVPNWPTSAPVAAAPAPVYQAPPVAASYNAFAAPYPAPPPPSYVPRVVEPEGDMTEIVQLVRPPRRRLAVIVVTSLVVAAAVVAAVVLATRDPSSSPSPSAAPIAKDPPVAPVTPTDPVDDPPDPPEAPPAVVPPPPPDQVAIQPPVPPTPAGSCKVSFLSSPDGAEVVVAKAVLGKTPLTVERPCAPFTAAFRRGRYQTATRKVVPKAGTSRVQVRLERPTYKVRVTSTPAGAVVKIAGAEVGRTPTSLSVPGFESVSVELTKPGFFPATQRVYANKPGGKLDVKLKPKRR